MLKLTVLMLLVASVIASDDIHFTDCTGHHEVTRVRFTGCTSHDLVCKVRKNVDQMFEVDFVANQNSKTAKMEMVAEINGVTIQVPGLDSDACNKHLKCPVVKGQSYVFNYKLNLPSIIPNVRAKVIAKLVGDNGVLACAGMNGQVVDN